MQNTAPPTEGQLGRVRDALGADSLTYSHRIEGGVGAAMDVLVDGSTRMVLRRYGPWYAERGEDASMRETRALELLQRANIPAPAPLWVDTDGVFDEQAILISFVDGKPDLTPSNPFEWAAQLAAVLVRIHDVRLEDADLTVFPPGAGEDEKKVQESPELVLEHPLGEDLLRRRVMLGNHRAESEEVFSHTDFWPGNVLWDNGSLKAVVDWESPATGDREMDVAYCSLDIRYLGMDRVADHFVSKYREISGASLPNLAHWEAVGLCRPMPNIAKWVPAWRSMGRDIDPEAARTRFNEVLENFLERTS